MARSLLEAFLELRKTATVAVEPSVPAPSAAPPMEHPVPATGHTTSVTTPQSPPLAAAPPAAAPARLKSTEFMDLAPGRNGFPRPFSGQLQPVPIPFLRTYFPVYANLAPDEQRAYVYIRQAYLNGTPVPDVPLTYIFLFAYEIGANAKTLKQCEEQLTALRATYAEQSAFAQHLAAWIVHCRLAAKKYVWDDIAAGMKATDPILRLDLQLHARQSPSSTDLVRVAVPDIQPPALARLVRVIDALRENEGSDPLLAAARKGASGQRTVPLFKSYPIAFTQYLAKHTSATMPTFCERPSPAMDVVDALVATAHHLLGARDAAASSDAAPNADLDPQTSLLPHGPNPVLRRPLSDPYSIDGLLWTARTLWTPAMQIVTALVLWQADVKPYIEGLTVYSTEFRQKFETLTAALGTSPAPMSLRSAFAALSYGPRAPWVLDRSDAGGTDVLIGKVGARFPKPLQRELRGSANRALLLSALVEAIASDFALPPDTVTAHLAAAAGCTAPQGFSPPSPHSESP